MRFPLLTALLALFIACSLGGFTASVADEDPLAPIYGQWRVNYEWSYAKAIADDDLPERNPVVIEDYVNQMMAVMSLSFTDSLITYTRGRHSRDLEFEVESTLDGEITLKIITPKGPQFWVLTLDEEGFLHLESDATTLKDFWVYEPGALETKPIE